MFLLRHGRVRGDRVEVGLIGRRGAAIAVPAHGGPFYRAPTADRRQQAGHPVFPSHLAVGEHRHARLILQLDRVPGRPVLGVPQLGGAQIPAPVRRPRRQQPGRAQQAANMLGVVLGGHWLPPCPAGNVLSLAWSRSGGKVTPAAAAQKPSVLAPAPSSLTGATWPLEKADAVVTAPAQPINRKIAEELGVREGQVTAAVDLLDGGATVPFVARYRKEVTGALDDAQLRTLEERLRYLRELEERRAVILESVRSQGKLDAALEAAILTADSKGRLEDIYLPFKPKRRTKAEIAREAGLEPLSELLLTQPQNDPQLVAADFVNDEKQVVDAAAALEGARAILVERFAEDADLIGTLREQMWSNGLMTSTVRKGKKTEGEKFKDYFDFSEPLHKLPSHRILAMFRGEKEEILDLQMLSDAQPAVANVSNSYELKIMHRFAIS